MEHIGVMEYWSNGMMERRKTGKLAEMEAV
jgi:hypothetical protein